MADVRLPGTLTPLFPGLPRRLEIEAATVLGAIDEVIRVRESERKAERIDRVRKQQEAKVAA